MGDINCKNKADYLVTELKKCQDAMGTGYLSAFPSLALDQLEANVNEQWAPYYTLHKILAGLMDCYKYCGNTTALDMENKLAAYIKGRMDKLTQTQINNFLETRPFVWNFYHEHGGIGEALLDLYQVTSNANNLSLANVFDRSYFTDPLATNVDEIGYQEYHANSHIPMVSALARHYEVTDDTKYRNTVTNYLNMMTGGHTFPTGGTSGTSPSHVRNMTGEYWSYPNLFYEHTLNDTGESCCSHNLNEIAEKVFTWTADPKYADEYEKRFVNAVLSQQNPSNGMLLYNLSVTPNSYVTFSRIWSNGDLLEISLPFNLRTVRMPDRPDYVAVFYGPELLVACTSGGAKYNGSESQLLSALTPVSGQACTFTANLTTGNVTFKPLNRVTTGTYNGYTIITNPIVATVKDYVTIADSASETSHTLQSSGSSTGSANGKNWRAASNGGWFSYKLAVDSGKTMYVRCTYWGSDAANRVFYLQIDGNNIATQRLENNSPNNFFQLIYPVPVAFTNGKTSVILKFQAKSGDTAGGVFDRVEMLSYFFDI